MTFVRNSVGLKVMSLKTQSHYEQSFQRDFDNIRKKVQEMAGMGESALQNALRALLDKNRQLAYTIILRDQLIDEKEEELDRLCLEFLVRQQPVASPLRFIYSVIKINKELERIGDYAESIARQVIFLSSMEKQPSYHRFIEIANLSVPMLHDSIRAFVERDADLAAETMKMEERIDGIRKEIDSDLLKQRQEGLIPLEALTPLMTIARRFERVSDHAQNICEETIYVCTGESPRHKGNEAFRVLFVDQRNSCRSQMAEAIGESLGLGRFVFSSAGLTPEPIDQRTVQFLREKGIDMTRQTSKGLDWIPHLDHYQIIVALAKEAEKAFPTPRGKTVCLEWHVKDPSREEGDLDNTRDTYEATYAYLKHHIQDLAEAVLGDKIN